MLLLGQTNLVNSNSALDSKLAGMSFEDGTVLEHVMRSDANRERAIVEARRMFTVFVACINSTNLGTRFIGSFG